jgi:hypothetical protein
MKQKLLALFALSIILVSCSKKEDTPKLMLDLNELSLKFDQEHQFKITQGGEEVDASTYEWTSSDEITGSVGGGGLFQASRIGKSTVTAKRGDESVSAQITVVHYTSFFAEPYIDFNANKATIKSREARELSQNGETADALLYAGENNKISNVLYRFENGVLLGAAVVFNTPNINLEETATFFLERYAFIGEIEETYYFAFGETIVGVGNSAQLGFSAIYLQDPEGQAAARTASQAKTMIDNHAVKLKRLR